MNSVTYANELVKKQGFQKALEIAETKAREMIAVGLSGPAYADEVELKDKVIVVIDEAGRIKRLEKLTAFWKSVHGYLRNKKAKTAVAA